MPPWDKLCNKASSGTSSSYLPHFTGEPYLAKSFWSGLIAQWGPEVAGFVEYGTWDEPTSIFCAPWSSSALVGPPALKGNGSLVEADDLVPISPGTTKLAITRIAKTEIPETIIDCLIFFFLSYFIY